MKSAKFAPTLLFVGLVLLPVAACSKGEAPQAPEQAPPPTNRIDVPETVRQNLGIRFVKVERRRIAATLRVPGQFELLPAARREYRTPFAGRVEIAVAPLQAVAAGDLLYRIESPAWRAAQRELSELLTQSQVADSRLSSMRPLLAAHEVHEQSLAHAIEVVRRRVQSLEATRANVGGQAGELAGAEVQSAQLQAELAEAHEKHAELQATIAELEATLAATRLRFRFALQSAAGLVGITAEQLEAAVPDAGQEPRWRHIDWIEVKAVGPGVVDRFPVASGGWVEAGALVVASADLSRLRFRARGLQSDLGLLRDGLPVAIVPAHEPPGQQAPMVGLLELGAEADPSQRTIDLFTTPAPLLPFARPGVTAFLEVETAAGGERELAIPKAAVLQDGLQRVLFRRDPKDPDRVIRLPADLGLDDGRWVEVKSGLVDGDEVVLQGAYELMLASSGADRRGGHFHADGTFHADAEHK